MTKDEVLKLALEALEKSVATCFDRCAHEQVMSRPEHFINQAITAIKDALAQPEQEPVAWMSPHLQDRDGDWVYDFSMYRDDYYMFPVYNTPPQRTWAELTQDEFEQLINDAGFTRTDLLMMGACVEQIVHLVEIKLKEKNYD